MAGDDQATAVDRPEDRFDAAAVRFRQAAEKAHAACLDLAQGARALVAPAAAPPAPPAMPPAIPSELFAPPLAAASPLPPVFEDAAPLAPVVDEPAVESAPPAAELPAQPAAPPVTEAPPPPEPPEPPEPPAFSFRRPPAAALLDAIGPIDLGPHALEPLDGRLRWRVPLATGRAIEVAAGPEDAETAQARHWSEGFGDLYEPIAELGEAAVWEPLSHTLHTHERGWAVTATVDVTFGSELAAGDLFRIADVARAALAARPEKLPPAAPPPRPGLLRRGRRG